MFRFNLVSIFLIFKTYQLSTLISNQVHHQAIDFYNSSSSLHFLTLTLRNGSLSYLDYASHLHITNCSLLIYSLVTRFLTGCGNIHMEQMHISFQHSSIIDSLVYAEPSLSVNHDSIASYLPSITLSQTVFEDSQILETTGTLISTGATHMQKIQSCTFTNVTTCTKTEIYSHKRSDGKVTLSSECCITDTTTRNCEDSFYGRIAKGESIELQSRTGGIGFFSGFLHSKRRRFFIYRASGCLGVFGVFTIR